MTKFNALGRQYWPTIILFILLLAAWQLTVSVGGIREYLLPAPCRCGTRCGRARSPGASICGPRPSRSSAPFLMAAVVGVALGVAIAWSPLFANALVPFLVFVNNLPKVAIAPLFLIWMGYGIFPTC